MPLTDEQRAVIDANRRRAKELFDQRQAERAKAQQPSAANDQARANPPPRPQPPPRAPQPSASGGLGAPHVRPMGGSRPPQSMPSVPPRGQPPSLYAKMQASTSTSTAEPPEKKVKVAVTPRQQPPSPIVDPLAGYKPKAKINFVVLNDTAIKIDVEPYHSAIVNAIRSFHSSIYDHLDKQWTVGFEDYHNAKRAIEALRQVECSVTPLPPWVLKTFQHEINTGLPLPKADNNKQMHVEQSLLSKLFPYQREGLNYGIEKNGRLLLCDEMGLGKSIQALAIARVFSSDWPLLIVCPASVRHSWKQQFETFLPAVNNIHMIDKTSTALPRDRTVNTVMIMSYDVMTAKEDELTSAQIYMVIFDECHMLKSSEAKRTKAAAILSKRARRCILLSGTPMPSKPIELWSQTRLVDDKLFPTKTPYATRYCERRLVRKGRFTTYEDDGAANLTELTTILKRTMMLRRYKKDVLTELPDKLRRVMYLTGPRIEKKLKELRQARENCEAALDKGTASEKQATYMQYYAESGMAKASSVSEYIIETYFYTDAPPVKLIVFAHHRDVLDQLAHDFETAKIEYARIDGSTTGNERASVCERFQTRPEIQIALLSITAAGVGITLTAANKVIFAELFWNPGSLTQAEDRAHRVGQKDSVMVVYMLARKTIDDNIWPKINDKLHVLSGVDLANESFSTLENDQRVVDDSISKITDFFDVVSATL